MLTHPTQKICFFRAKVVAKDSGFGAIRYIDPLEAGGGAKTVESE